MSNKPTSSRSAAPGVDPAPHAADTAQPDPSPALVNDASPNLTKADDPKALPGNGATAEVEMVKVRTKEDSILMDPYSARHIDREGGEVPVTTFINDELAEGGRLEKF
jgi:hypothetical protein